MSDDREHDNLISMHGQDAHDPSDPLPDVIHTIICMRLQQEAHEMQIIALKQAIKTLVIVTIVADLLGIYTGYFIALEALRDRV